MRIAKLNTETSKLQNLYAEALAGSKDLLNLNQNIQKQVFLFLDIN